MLGCESKYEKKNHFLNFFSDFNGILISLEVQALSPTMNQIYFPEILFQ